MKHLRDRNEVGEDETAFDVVVKICEQIRESKETRPSRGQGHMTKIRNKL